MLGIVIVVVILIQDTSEDRIRMVSRAVEYKDMPASPRAPKCAAGPAWANAVRSPVSRMPFVGLWPPIPKPPPGALRRPEKACKHRAFCDPPRANTGASPEEHRINAFGTGSVTTQPNAERKLNQAEPSQPAPLSKSLSLQRLRSPPGRAAGLFLGQRGGRSPPAPASSPSARGRIGLRRDPFSSIVCC